MVNRAEIIETARTFLGTPFRHQGRVKGRGCDCAGIIVGVAKELKLSDFNFIHYGMSPNADKLRQILDEEAVPTQDQKLGSILLMTFDQEPQHLAIVTDIGILHAYSLIGRCVEHNLDALWTSRIAAMYDFPGVTD